MFWETIILAFLASFPKSRKRGREGRRTKNRSGGHLSEQREKRYEKGESA